MKEKMDQQTATRQGFAYYILDFKSLYRRSKLVKRVVILLNSATTMNAIEISAVLGIKEKQFINFLKNIKPFEIFFTRFVGSELLVSLSPKGFLFYRYINLQKEEK